MPDLNMVDTINGGDLDFQGRDFLFDDTYSSMVYQALFGGEGWWGNALLSGSNRFESETQKAVATVALNSSGRIVIENAVKSDLAFIKDNVQGSDISVTVSILSDDRIGIYITVTGTGQDFKVSSIVAVDDRSDDGGIFTEQFTIEFL